jgi:primosomal protein N' (replication factor Y)
MPQIELVDMTRQPSHDGLSPAMLNAIRQQLDKKKQVMLFLNRRGFAPVIYCAACQKTARCHRCDSHLTLHRRANKMRCHHCGYEGPLQQRCGACQADKMIEIGEGTQRVEDALELRFPNARLLRIDRDSTRRKGELASLLEQARQGKADILLGTQLITKGHDFPNVGLVGILDADQGLYSIDYRASESLFQQIMQVAGRAGRRHEVGQVLIQTRFVAHPLFAKVMQHDYDGFAKQLLTERKQAHFPPFGHFALIRAESTYQAKALQFLRRAKQDMRSYQGVHIMDAVPAPMERRAGKYRGQLLLIADQRSALNSTLQGWLEFLATDREAKKQAGSVRWGLDIDPLDHY